MDTSAKYGGQIHVPFGAHVTFKHASDAIYKMFGLRHFQALKNDRSVGWDNFFHFFYIFNFFIPGLGDITREC